MELSPHIEAKRRVISRFLGRRSLKLTSDPVFLTMASHFHATHMAKSVGSTHLPDGIALFVLKLIFPFDIVRKSTLLRPLPWYCLHVTMDGSAS